MENTITLPQTVSENETLSESKKLEMLKLAKGGTWYDDWKPYCCQTITTCHSRLARMIIMKYGFRCAYCGDMLGWGLNRLKESPLNKK
jgi:hypothetical protein